ncbi:hypothetical protein A2153_03115 [Candidatus Gottesmanbacteria bacterium RBG_16_38_7b]|uniref:Transporter n=1 Tax=Candidatus Gottesmanbacteria bacterium RBG_16_38_7b TaxID=1798372 RepID=A0A1F5YL91_9BACT|nr:MAG: hypothetical protein A2153_03115 [Candidatus Gottesmanbacteria bacterium RBG_16_38_7b]
MEIFLSLFTKIIPLYIYILFGFITGKYLKINKQYIATLLIYIIAPLVIFHGLFTSKIDWRIIGLPLIFLGIACLISLTFYSLLKSYFKDNTRNLLGFSAGNANTGYFGLPVSIILFGENAVNIVTLAIIGMILYENTLGFFITARGNHTVGESVNKIIRLPAVYAFIIGLLFNVVNLNLGPVYYGIIFFVRQIYSVLGMMIIGMALSEISKFIIDWKFIILTFLAKFAAWPVLMIVFISMDNNFFHIFDGITHQIMLILSVVPLAANTVAFATLLKVQPQKAAVTVLLSTVFALFYIPLIVSVFL